MPPSVGPAGARLPSTNCPELCTSRAPDGSLPVYFMEVQPGGVWQEGKRDKEAQGARGGRRVKGGAGGDLRECKAACASLGQTKET